MPLAVNHLPRDEVCAPLLHHPPQIIRGQYPPLSSRYSTELRSLIDNMITRDPKKRPSINQILAEPIIKNRIQQFLSATLRAEEFSHTIIHQRPKPGQLVPGQPVRSPPAAPSRGACWNAVSMPPRLINVGGKRITGSPITELEFAARPMPSLAEGPNLSLSR